METSGPNGLQCYVKQPLASGKRLRRPILHSWGLGFSPELEPLSTEYREHYRFQQCREKSPQPTNSKYGDIVWDAVQDELELFCGRVETKLRSQLSSFSPL